jgi:hypothetical protein
MSLLAEFNCIIALVKNVFPLTWAVLVLYIAHMFNMGNKGEFDYAPRIKKSACC